LLFVRDELRGHLSFIGVGVFFKAGIHGLFIAWCFYGETLAVLESLLLLMELIIPIVGAVRGARIGRSGRDHEGLGSLTL